MPRGSLISIWLVLASTFLGARVLSTYVSSGYMEWNGEFWAQLAIVPLFQAGILICLSELTREPTLTGVLVASLRRYPLLVMLLALDLFLVITTLAGWPLQAIELGSEGNLAAYYFALRAASLGLILLVAGSRSWLPPAARLPLVLLGILTFALGLESTFRWLRLPVLYEVGLGLGLIATVRLFVSMRGRQPAAAGTFSLALMLLVPAYLVAGLIYLHTAELPGWAAKVSASLVLLAFNALLIGLTQLWPGTPKV